MTTENIQEAPVRTESHTFVRPEIKPYDGAFAWITFILGYLFVKFVFYNIDGFVTTAVCIAMFVCGVLYVIKCGKKPTASQWVLGAVICCFSFVFSFTANRLMHDLCFLFLIAAQFWWVQAVCINARFVTKFFWFDLWRTVFVQPFRDFSGFFRAAFASVKNGKSSATVKAVIAGIVMTVPLTVIVAGLLSGADENIENMLSDVLNAIRRSNVFGEMMQVFLAIPVGAVIFGMLRADAKQKLYPLPSDICYNEKISRLKIFENVGIYAGVTPICVLYLIYIVSQTNYFVSAFFGRLPNGTDYAEYARRGFFELCAIAVINLAVIISMLAFAKKGGSERTKPLTVFTCMLCGFTLFIIATALAKMVLYVQVYGLTRLRLYTSWFMVLLGVIFVTITVRALVKKLPTAKILSASFIVMFAFLCFSRPDALIAEYNISRYEAGTLKNLDVSMLCELSDDALAVMTNHSDTIAVCDTNAEFETCLKCKVHDYEKYPIDASNVSSQKLIAYYRDNFGE